VQTPSGTSVDGHAGAVRFPSRAATTVLAFTAYSAGQLAAGCGTTDPCQQQLPNAGSWGGGSDLFGTGSFNTYGALNASTGLSSLLPVLDLLSDNGNLTSSTFNYKMFTEDGFLKLQVEGGTPIPLPAVYPLFVLFPVVHALAELPTYWG